jgi:flagellar hook-length control protein FliK
VTVPAGAVAASAPSSFAPGTVPTSVGAPAPPPPTPAQQVVTVLTPLRSSADGTHEVTIGLEPDGLGTVKATITVSSGEIMVRLGTDNAETRDALRQALPQLEHELGGDGSTATVMLSDGHHQGRRTLPESAGGRAAGSNERDRNDDPSSAPVAKRARAAGRVDLHL